jgi:queuine tRNA-ribosyltransferase
VAFSFHLHHTDATTAARRSTFVTPHGAVEMPAFMPVGTLASVKGLEVEQLRGTGAQMVLANTYHLALRPGEEVVAELGGLHAFMGWDGPILTDSGGFQIFSLAHMSKVSEEQAVFRSHIDGHLLAISPERAVAIQEALGSDVAMVLDHVVQLPNEPAVVRDACERSAECAIELRKLDFPGYAVGGLSVGEAPCEMYRILDATVPHLPADRPRYLMGVGRPADLLEAVARGIDLLDCVMPTRNGRNAMAFTDAGPIRLRNLQYERDQRPLEEGCPCPACRRSRAYIRHLFMAGEMLGPILLSIHNLTYYQRLLAEARAAIEADQLAVYRAEKIRGWGSKP